MKILGRGIFFLGNILQYSDAFCVTIEKVFRDHFGLDTLNLNLLSTILCDKFIFVDGFL